jgi:hypothetical protein
MPGWWMCAWSSRDRDSAYVSLTDLVSTARVGRRRPGRPDVLDVQLKAEPGTARWMWGASRRCGSIAPKYYTR